MAVSFVMTAALALAVPTAGQADERATGSAEGEAALTERLRGLVPGVPLACVSARQLRESDTIANTAIVYRTNGSRVYVNRPRGDLTELRSDRILMSGSGTTQLCDADIVDLASRTDGRAAATVTLGRFVPYDRPRKR